MRRSTTLLLFLSILTLAGPAASQDISALNGAWILATWTNPDGETQEAQRGAFIFAITREDGGTYAMMFNNTDAERPTYDGDSLTDAEKLAAYDSFTANMGRLTVEGHSLRWEAYVAKDPNYMSEWPDNDQTADWSLEDGILTLSFSGDGFMSGFTATLRRPNAD